MSGAPLLLRSGALLLARAAEAEVDPRAFLTEGLGLAPLEDAWQNAALAGALEDALEAVETLGGAALDAMRAWDTEDRFLAAEAVARMVQALGELTTVIEKLPAAFNTARDSFLDPSKAEIDGYLANPERLVERAVGFFLMVGLSRHAPEVITPLSIAGLIEWQPRNSGLLATSGVPDYIGIVRIDRLPALLSDPVAVMSEAHGWGTPDLNLEPILRMLHNAAPGRKRHMPNIDGRAAALLPAGLLREDFDPALPGIRYELSDEIDLDAEGRFPFAKGWSLELAAKLTASGDLAFGLYPPNALTFEAGAAADGALRLGIAYLPDGDRPLLDLPFASVSLEKLSLGVGAKLEAEAASGGQAVVTGQPEVDLGVEGLTLGINGSEGDGFLKSLLGAAKPSGRVDLNAIWSPEDGVRFEGSGSLVIREDQEVDLGPLKIDAFEVALGFENGGMRLSAGVDLGAKLGPIDVTVERMGAAVSLEPGAGGAVSVGTSFLPPRGLGLSIDAGPVTGGGYLFFDFDNAEYAGVLDLTIGEIGVTAVGLLTTKLPDGDDGFSLVLIITAEFPPIPLGFGFTLDGLGGLIGVNRGSDVDALREGVRTGTIGSIMFPENPVENASRIVSDIGRAFPPVRGQHVLGPMAMLGWGSPALLRAELGLLLELDSPLRLIVLGQIHAGMPSLDVAPRLVELHLDVLGIVDFDRQEISVDARLFDSRVSIYALSGEMAMRLRWGDAPFFALSVGGLHPAFPRPPELPKLERLALSLGSSNNPRLRLEAYMAITSNTVQFGALLDIYAAAAGFSVAGQLGFDALFEFNPFGFKIDMRASVALRRGSQSLFTVALDLELSGPGPWHVVGNATFRVVLIDAEIPFDVTFGSRARPALPEADPRAALLAALADPQNWEATPPETLRVKLTGSASKAAGRRVHPAGQLSVRQTVLPLGLELERFANVSVGAGHIYTLDAMTFGVGEAARTVDIGGVLKEHFAPASYIALTDAEKLSYPSFERMTAGGTADADRAITGAPPSGQSRKSLETKTVVVDHLSAGGEPGADLAAAALDADTVAVATELSASGKAASERARRGRAASAKMGIGLVDDQWVIATTRSLKVVSETGLPHEGIAPIPELSDPEATTHSGALIALRSHLKRHPDDADRLQIVAAHELEAA